MSIRKLVPGFFKKLQSQPEETRKIILWSVVVIIGLAFFLLWLQSIKSKLKNFQKEELFQSIGAPKLQEELKKMPEIGLPEMETPELSEEELRQLEEALKEAEVQSPQP